MTSSPRSIGGLLPAVGLPGEESRCRLQDLVFLAKEPEFLALGARQPLRAPLVDVGLRYPVAKRLVGDP